MREVGGGSRAITGAASGLTLALTAGAFWLSYAHLHQVAAGHGMAGEQIRSWAWPGTIDLFIAIGDLLTLRASLARRVDWWAVGLTVIGSGGSIALNVAGVGPGASTLDYVVAAVPPVAALLAFGALMRQVHDFLSGREPGEAEATPPLALTRGESESERPAPAPERAAPVKKASESRSRPLVFVTPLAPRQDIVSLLLADEPPEWAGLSLREAVARADAIAPGQTASALAAALSQVGVTATAGSIRSTRSALRRQKEKAMADPETREPEALTLSPSEQGEALA
ncbi:DUF2637 domain-containing protein [Streptomyces sp. NPDC093084]|uniref:DUF2637 domain-containing protein n=1 Tax=Streptomyces sp. NPDC093084 TaxID=3155197 RepID=UPI00341B14A7